MFVIDTVINFFFALASLAGQLLELVMTGLALAAEACGIETMPSNFAMVITVLALTGKYMSKMFS